MDGESEDNDRDMIGKMDGNDQVQQGSEKFPGEGLGGFGAEPVRFNRVREKVIRRRFRRRFRKRFQEVWVAMPSQVRFRRRPGRLWCRAGSGSTGFRKRFRRRSGRLWCRARSGSTGCCTVAAAHGT